MGCDWGGRVCVDCGGCEEIVRHVLEQQTGVKGCSVSHESGEARVAVDESRISDEQLAEAVRGAGYSANIMNTTE